MARDLDEMADEPMEGMPDVSEIDSFRRHDYPIKIIQNFLTWLEGQGLAVCSFDDDSDEWIRFYMSGERLAANHFGVNLDRVHEQEINARNWHEFGSVNP